MRNDSPLAVIWRRKGIIIAVFLAFTATTAIVSKTLDPVYETRARLFITLPADTQSFDTVQASQAFARSFATVLDSPNIAQRVADQIGGDNQAILDATKFEPVEETQLLQISAEDHSAERAQQIANGWAMVATDYAKTNLQENTRANITLADGAPRPGSPERPKPTLYTLLAGILGLVLGTAAAFLRDRLDNRLRTSEDVELRFDTAVLARIPRKGRSDTSEAAFREAFRLLRTNVQFATRGTRAGALAITSGRQDEGKTTTIMQLAIANAEVGQRVIVVEADFRRPALQRALLPDQEPLRPGFSNYLVEAASLEDVIHSTNRPNISIVPAGPLPPSPSALLESRRGQRAVSDFLTQADLVLVDCPPLSIGADASVIAGWVDGVILVVDLGGSTDKTVRDAVRQLEAVHANLLGLVLNRDKGAEPSSYDYYLSVGSSDAGGGRGKGGDGKRGGGGRVPAGSGSRRS
jgi:capsular exopolysaccharide synthesis family protein